MSQIAPIFSALRRHKAGTVLIALQIALTLAIVCNALFIVEQRVSRLGEPSGVDESNLFIINNQWGSDLNRQQMDAAIQSDLATLRQLPAVSDASQSNSFPLMGGGWDELISLRPDQQGLLTDATVYLADEHMLHTLGLNLIAGRNFSESDVGVIGPRQDIVPNVVIVSKAAADRLFPDGNALGKQFFAENTKPVTIIGIVDVLQRQSVDDWNLPYAYQTMLWPLRNTQSSRLFYLVRAKPGQLAAAMAEAPKALFAANPMRVIPAKDGVKPYTKVRYDAYERFRGMAILMGVICVVLLAITAAGIVGLTSFWVGQRRRQIGVRRALGATRRDILAYFLTENLLISSIGAVVGVVLALAFNLWLMKQYTLGVMPLFYLAAGVVLLILLGQGAVLAPAMRASRVSPIEATRPA